MTHVPAVAGMPGLKGYEASARASLFAPQRLPDAIRDPVAADITVIMTQPDIVGRNRAFGQEMFNLSTGTDPARSSRVSGRMARGDAAPYRCREARGIDGLDYAAPSAIRNSPVSATKPCAVMTVRDSGRIFT